MTNLTRAWLLTPGASLTSVHLGGEDTESALSEHIHTDRFRALPIGDTGVDVWHPVGNSGLPLNLMALRVWVFLTGAAAITLPPRFIGNVVLGSRDRNGKPAGLSIEGESRLRQEFEKHSASTCRICRYSWHRIIEPVRG